MVKIVARKLRVRIIFYVVIAATVVMVNKSAFAQSASKGMWQNIPYNDTLSGKVVARIAIDPTSDTDNEFDETGVYIKCEVYGTLQLYVGWDQKMTSDNSISSYEIDYRIGSGSVQSENWSLSTDNTALYYTGNTVNFIDELESSSIFVAQVTPTGGNAITATYDTTGLKTAVAPVLKACGFGP